MNCLSYLFITAILIAFVHSEPSFHKRLRRHMDLSIPHNENGSFSSCNTPANFPEIKHENINHAYAGKSDKKGGKKSGKSNDKGKSKSSKDKKEKSGKKSKQKSNKKPKSGKPKSSKPKPIKTTKQPTLSPTASLEGTMPPTESPTKDDSVESPPTPTLHPTNRPSIKVTTPSPNNSSYPSASPSYTPSSIPSIISTLASTSDTPSMSCSPSEQPTIVSELPSVSPSIEPSISTSPSLPPSISPSISVSPSSSQVPPNYVYDKESGSLLELEENISLILPSDFFEHDATVHGTKSNSYMQTFEKTTTIHGIISQLPYFFQVKADSPPATKKFGEATIVLPTNFTSSLQDNEKVGVLFRMLQSSDTSDPFAVFSLANSEFDQNTRQVRFSLPNYAFHSVSDADIPHYVATIAVATRNGPSTLSARRRLSSTSSSVRCEAVSIRCPLGVNECGDEKVLSPFDLSRTVLYNGAHITAPHWGVDYYAEFGDFVYAAADGVVSFSGLSHEYSDAGYGDFIIIRHSDGSSGLYAHLSNRLVVSGDSVDAGSKIGQVGQSGSAYVPQLHLEYVPSGSIYNSDFRIDPHPCTQSYSKGSISIGSSEANSDDIFSVFIDDNFLGSTGKGITNNIAVSGYLPGDYTLKVVVVDDGGNTGTFHIEMYDGFIFHDGTTVRDYSDFPDLFAGDDISFAFSVPQKTPSNGHGVCNDGFKSKGKCLLPGSSCDSPTQLSLPALNNQCKDFDTANEPSQCCYSTPKCYRLGGHCMQTSECGPSSYSVVNKCPGQASQGDIQCCIPKNTCLSVGGECRNDCASGEFESYVMCPSGEGSKCCLPSVTCVGQGEFSAINGFCTKKASCIGDTIPAGRGHGCEQGAIDVECCIPSPSCKFISNNLPYFSGTCRSECKSSEKEFMSLYPQQCEKCCAIDPDPPEHSVSELELLKFESTLIEENLIADDDVHVKHGLDLAVECVKSNDSVYPKLLHSEKKIEINKLDRTQITDAKDMMLNDGNFNNLFVHWKGTAFDGDEYEGLNDYLNAYGESITIWDSVSGLNEIMAKSISEKLLIPDYHLYSTFTGKLSQLGKAAGHLGYVMSAHWVLKEFLDVKIWWIYERTIVFRCEETSVEGKYKVKSFEVQEPGPSSLPSSSRPMVDFIQEHSSAKYYTEHVSSTSSHSSVETYELPSEESRLLTRPQHFAVSTRLQKRGIFSGSKVMEHHEFTVSASCNKNDGSINFVGILGPFIKSTSQSWLDMFDDEIPERSTPVASVRYSPRTNTKLLVTADGVAHNGNTDTFSLGLSFGSVIQLALFVLQAILPVTTTAPPAAVVVLGAIAVGLFLASLIDNLEPDYAFEYHRAIILECRQGYSGDYYVHRLKEDRTNILGNICYDLKTSDIDDKEDYYLEIDDGFFVDDRNGFALYHVKVMEPTFVVQKEACHISTLIQKEDKWSNRKELSLPITSEVLLTRVGISGNTIIVGAPDEDAINSLGTSAAYVVEKNESNGEWEVFQKLSLSDDENYYYFGYSVAISKNEIVVGSLRDAGGPIDSGDSTGDFFIFEYNKTLGKWEEADMLTTNNGIEEEHIAMTEGIIVIGSWSNNFVYVFEKNENTSSWEEKQIILIEESAHCRSVGVSGNVIAVGAASSKVNPDGSVFITHYAVYVYELDENSDTWIRVNKLNIEDTKDGTDNEWFGFNIGVSGRTIVIGSPEISDDEEGAESYTGAAYIFEKNESSGKWVELKRLDDPGDKSVADNGWFGYTVGVFEDTIVIGNYMGKSYMYQRDKNGDWDQIQELTTDCMIFFNYGVSENAIVVGGCESSFSILILD